MDDALFNVYTVVTFDTVSEYFVTLSNVRVMIYG